MRCVAGEVDAGVLAECVEAMTRTVPDLDRIAIDRVCDLHGVRAGQTRCGVNTAGRASEAPQAATLSAVAPPLLALFASFGWSAGALLRRRACTTSVTR